MNNRSGGAERPSGHGLTPDIDGVPARDGQRRKLFGGATKN